MVASASLAFHRLWPMKDRWLIGLALRVAVFCRQRVVEVCQLVGRVGARMAHPLVRGAKRRCNGPQCLVL